MVGAVLAGDGLERVAEIASSHAGAPVAVIVPRLGAPWRGGGTTSATSALAWRAAPQAPEEIKLEVPISSGGRELGAVLMLGRGSKDAGEYLHMAAIAALTEVAVVEARDETEQSLRGSFLEEALTRTDMDPADAERRAARLGCDLSGGLHRFLRGPGLLAARPAAWRRWPPRCRGCSPSRWTARCTRCSPAIPILPAAWPRGWAGTRWWGSPPTTRRAAHLHLAPSRRPSSCSESPRRVAARPVEGDRRWHLPASVPRDGEPSAGGAELLRGHRFPRS